MYAGDRNHVLSQGYLGPTVRIWQAELGRAWLLDATAPITQGMFFGCAMMAVLSLLFCLFEDENPPSRSPLR